MHRRGVLVLVASAFALLYAACGGGAPRSATADLLALSQPTPDPTLDAVVRGLPRALAGTPPTSTPTPVSVPKPSVRAPAPTPRPAAPKPTPTTVRRGN